MHKVLKSILLAALLFAAPLSSAFGQYNGIMGILDSAGNLYGWITNDGTNDIYGGGFAVDSDGALWCSGAYCGPSYDYYNGGSWGGNFAVNGDGLIMGMLTGIQVAALNADDVVPNALLTFSSTLTDSTGNPWTVPPASNGSIWAAQYFDAPNGGFNPTYFQAGSSPFFWIYSGTLVDGRNGWNSWYGNVVTAPPPPPSAVYINGVLCQPQGPAITISNTDYSDTTYYANQAGDTYVQIYRPYYSGNGQAGRIWGHCAQGDFDTSFDVGTWDTGDLPNNIDLTFNAPPAIPTYGPNSISWNHCLLQFYYTTGDAHAVYWNPGDADGDYTVLVGQDNSASAIHATISTTGTYDPSAHTFTFSDTADTSELLALNANGDPYCHELPAGMSFLFGSNGPGCK